MSGRRSFVLKTMWYSRFVKVEDMAIHNDGFPSPLRGLVDLLNRYRWLTPPATSLRRSAAGVIGAGADTCLLFLLTLDSQSIGALRVRLMRQDATSTLLSLMPA